MNTIDTDIDKNRHIIDLGLEVDTTSEEYLAKHEIKMHELEIFEI